MFPCSKFTRRLLCTSSSSSSPKPWLLIGLGNPGEKYQSTRHNVGFDMIDAFARSQGIPMSTVHFKALFGEGMMGDTPVILAKPQTYMNLSGESTGPLAAYYKLPLNRILVIYDDMDLPCGVLRVQPNGGHARHKGMKSVIYHFRGNREFGRLRIGIGRPPGQMDPKAFLLQKFNRTARERDFYPDLVADMEPQHQEVAKEFTTADYENSGADVWITSNRNIRRLQRSLLQNYENSGAYVCGLHRSWSNSTNDLDPDHTRGDRLLLFVVE